MSEVKIRRIGNSAGIILPSIALKELGLQIGSAVEIRVDRKRKLFLVRPVRGPKGLRIDPQFARDVEEFIRMYKPALDELAK